MVHEGREVITVKVDAELLSALDRYSMKYKMYRSEVVRQAIIEFLQRRGVKISG